MSLWKSDFSKLVGVFSAWKHLVCEPHCAGEIKEHNWLVHLGQFVVIIWVLSIVLLQWTSLLIWSYMLGLLSPIIWGMIFWIIHELLTLDSHILVKCQGLSPIQSNDVWWMSCELWISARGFTLFLPNGSLSFHQITALNPIHRIFSLGGAVGKTKCDHALYITSL